ncbi:MAG: hypothetical protein KA205_01895 [Acidobacteria bacterium]|nr:hypothetical protein [Acidobacteriota bacterium]
MLPWLVVAHPAAQSLPVITRFASARGGVGNVGFWTTDFLQWTVTGATSITIDQGVGVVTGLSSATITPTARTRYTLTATNAAGSTTATWIEPYVPLVQISERLYKTEHSIYYIPDPAQVTFPAYDSVLSVANINNIYLPQLQSAFPDDYMMVIVAANNLTPNNVPSVLTGRHLADGIGDVTATGVGIPNLCRYNIGGGALSTGALGVMDHEIGHNWIARLGEEVAIGHWHDNSTVGGQMANSYFVAANGGLESRRIIGTPATGFTWTGVDNSAKNETDTFADQDLYLMGLHPTFPDTYVLSNPVLNNDHTVSYSAVNTYGHAWMVGKNGVRTPNYTTSDKQFRLGVIYVAQTLAEVQESYLPWDLSVSHFANAEAVDTDKYRFQVPFLVETEFRASVNARLADLDGNTAPTLTLSSPSYVRSVNGTATITFTAADAGAPAPTVSLVPASASASITSNTITLQGLATGTHFVTIKAEDAQGKKAFRHVVVDVVAVPSFADDPLVIGTTTMKAAHVTELRTAIDTLRASRGLATYTWTPTTITAGSTPISAAIITQLRTALGEVYTAANRVPPTYTTLTAGTSLITAASITELRTAITAIWQ